MAIYNLIDFQTLLRSDGLYLFNEKNTRNFMYTNNWTIGDMENVLLSLVPTDFDKSIPNNKLDNPLRGVKRLDADVYKVTCCAESKKRATKETEIFIDIYIKLAIQTDKKGRQAGTISFHRENG